MIRTKLSSAFTIIFFSLLSWHCTKIDTTDVGSGLIPGVDNVNTFDTTLNVIANNIDSVSLGKGCTVIYPTDDHALGYIGNDPLFGTTQATLYTEFKPSIFPFYLPAKPADRTLDSMVLMLSYRRTFGDSTTPQSVKVYEISKNFTPDTSTCSTYLYNSATLLGSATYVPKRLGLDTVKGFAGVGDTTINVLRIKISNTLAQKFLNQDSSATSAFYSDSLFKNTLFRGFAIVSNNTGNGLCYFNLTDVNSRLALYYKYKRAGLKDTGVVTNFVFNITANSANNIVRSRTGSELSKNLTTPAPAGHNSIYIQTSPGSYAEVRIPGLTGLSNRIINRAELIIDQVAPSPTDPFVTPAFLYLDVKQNDTLYRPVPCDFVMVGGQPDITSLGGYRTLAKDSVGNSISRYTFNLTRYVQKVVTNGRENAVLRLRAPDYVSTSASYIDDCGQTISPLFFNLNSVAYGRLKVMGGTTASNRIRLRIIYSKL